MLARRLVIFFALAAVLAFGCNNGGSSPRATGTPAGTPEPEGTTVTSDDGKFSIFIPKGAMPDGTNASITTLAQEALPPELSQLVGSAGGYRLEPDGLTFSQPATATLKMERSELDDPADMQSAYALVSFNATAGREVLDSETTWTIENDSVAVTAQLQHFSSIARTKGSLQVRLEGHQGIRGVGEQYRLSVDIQDTRWEQVVLDDITVSWLASGVITTNAQPFSAQSLGPGYVVGVSYSDGFTCTAPGTGTNGVNVRTISKIPDDPSLATALRLTIIEPVRCPEGTAVRGLDTVPPPTAGSLRELHLVQTIGCEHTNPGVESELQKKGRIVDSDGNAVRGVSVTEKANGPGLIDDLNDTVLEEVGYGTTDSNGDFAIAWRIRKLGPYTTTVTDLSTSDGTHFAMDATSTTSSQYTVSQACTPP